MIERVGIFVDGNNVFRMQKDQGWWINWKKFLCYFGSGQNKEITECFYFTGMPHYKETTQVEQQRKFNAILSQMGFTVVQKELKIVGKDDKGREVRKANLDIEMTLRVMQGMPHYDEAVLVEGDGDFVPLVEHLRANGKRVVCVSSKEKLAAELRNAVHCTILLASIQKNIQDQRREKKP